MILRHIFLNMGTGTYHAACVPDTFEAVVGQRQVVFSWCPPLVTQHNGLITSYTLSCSPSPSSLPQSISQSGLLTVAGFSPDTSYSCSVVANNGLGSGPPAYTNFTTLQDCKSVHWSYYNPKTLFSFTVDSLFQFRLSGLLTSCSDLVVSMYLIKKHHLEWMIIISEHRQECKIGRHKNDSIKATDCLVC